MTENATENVNVINPPLIENENDDVTGDDLQIFDLMHESLESLEDRFVEYIDNPTTDEFKKFEELMSEYIKLARDIKNMAKSMIPKSERPSKINKLINDDQIQKPDEILPGVEKLDVILPGVKKPKIKVRASKVPKLNVQV